MEIVRAMARTNFDENEADRMMRDLNRVEQWFNNEDVTTNAHIKMKEHLESAFLPTIRERGDDDDDLGITGLYEPVETYNAVLASPFDNELKELRTHVELNKGVLGMPLYNNYMSRIQYAMTPKRDGTFTDKHHFMSLQKEFENMIRQKQQGTPYPNEIKDVEEYLENNKHILDAKTIDRFDKIIANLRKPNARGEFNGPKQIKEAKDNIGKTIENVSVAKKRGRPVKAKPATPTPAPIATASGKHHVSFHPLTKYKHINF